MIIYKVKLVGRKHPEIVYADYFKVDGGTLTFRRINANQGYPTFVKCFAPGSWVSVENETIKQEDDTYGT